MASKTLVGTGSRPLTGLPIWIVSLVSLLITVPLLCTPTTAGLLEMADLMAHPDLYDRKEVVVMGKVTQVQPVTDRDGQPAFKFLLEDGSGTVRVTSRTEVQNGEHVIVEGTFSRRRQGGRMTVYNEVTAMSVRPLNQLNPDLLG